MIINLPTKRIKAISRENNFQRFTYKMAAKTSRHRQERKSRHCHTVYTFGACSQDAPRAISDERRCVTDSRGSLPCKTPTGSSYSQVDDVITESDDVTAVSYDVAGYCACALQTRSVNGRQLQVRHATSFTTQSLRQSVIIIANDRCGGGVDQRSGGEGRTGRKLQDN